MHSLSPFVDRHYGSTAFLVGKGPSLDAFLAGRHAVRLPIGGPLVLGFLNDTVRYRREISAALARHVRTQTGNTDPVIYTYAFANDSIARWWHLYTRDDLLFQPARTINDPSMAAPKPACGRIVFNDPGCDLGSLALPRATLASRGLVAVHGTCDSAAQILYVMGCTNLVAVGCDGAGGRSYLEWMTSLRDDHAADYASIRRDFEQVILRLRMPTEFYGEARIRTPHPAGATVLRTIMPTVFRGQSVPAGADLPTASKDEAATLIGCGRAEYVPVPA